ncbi:GTP-binding protein 1, partial [Elasticomyces elasticus]
KRFGRCDRDTVAVVGNVDAGKSTLLGVLVKGGLDDGRGKMRVNLFRHKHEIESGRTSSVGMEIMGFDTKGEVVVSGVPGRKLSWEEIGKRSAKVISSPIWQVANDTYERQSSDYSAASRTTACSWSRRTTA